MSTNLRSSLVLFLGLTSLVSGQDRIDEMDDPLTTFFGNHPIEITPDPEGGMRELRVVDGPWGRLQYYPIHLEVPQSYVEYLKPRLDQTEWVFTDSTPQELVQYFESLGIVSEGRVGRFNAVGRDVFLYPSDAFVESFTHEQRAQLAIRLSKDPRNGNYHQPAIIDSTSPAAWFRDAGLDGETAQKIISLCYRRGDLFLFSDLPSILAQQKTLEDRNRLVRVFTRTRSLIARLNVKETKDLPKVVEYWSAGYKRKNVLTLLESVEAAPEIDRLDITHLLPPIPRMHIYTYPNLADVALDERRDCHWTCVNFFNSVPAPVLRSPTLRGEELFAELKVIEGEDPVFGDTIVFRDSDTGEPVHSMIYIAADIVFTKNGNSMYRPWALMLYRSVLARYQLGRNLEVEILRQM